EFVLAAALARSTDRAWATLALYLDFLAAFPDSHIVRKYGADTANDVCRAARPLNARIKLGEAPSALLPDLLNWDASLKRRGINPGTSADLTVATLFAHRLRTILPSARNSDWLVARTWVRRYLGGTVQAGPNGCWQLIGVQPNAGGFGVGGKLVSLGGDVMAKVNGLCVGESLVGEGNEVAHIDLIMGPRGSAAESAFAHALTNNKDGFTSLLAVVA